MKGSLQRIGAILLRHFYVLRHSRTRLIEIFYWPVVQVILWGFISKSLGQAGVSPLSVALGTFLGAVMLWDFAFRNQIGLSFAYLEEAWSRNLGHLFISPLRPWEWWTAMVLFGGCRAAAGMLASALIAVPLYGFSLFDLGWPLIAFFFNLMVMGWWLGFFIVAFLIRVGMGAESIAWAFSFLLAPISAAYYPVATLPDWLQSMALALPTAHVFEGLRALVQQGRFESGHMFWAFGLNVVYLLLSLAALTWSFNWARKAGTLLRTSE